MQLYEIIIIAVGLAMDAFAVSVCKGLSLGKIRPSHMVKAGIWFGGFQMLMPIIGFLLAELFVGVIDQFDHWIAFVLLALIGGNMVREAFGKDEEPNSRMDIKTMLLLAIATSIDALAVGVSFAFLEVNIIIAAGIIGIVAFLFSFGGIKIGSVFGSKYHKKAEFVGGVILILMGLRILLEGLGVI